MHIVLIQTCQSLSPISDSAFLLKAVASSRCPGSNYMVTSLSLSWTTILTLWCPLPHLLKSRLSSSEFTRSLNQESTHIITSIRCGRKSTLSTNCLSLRKILICKGQIRSQVMTRMPAKRRWISFMLLWTTISNRVMTSLVTLTSHLVTTAMLSQKKIPCLTNHISNLPSLLTTMIPESLKRPKKTSCTSHSMTFITLSSKACARTRTNKLTLWCWPSSLKNSAALSNSHQYRSNP